MTSSPLEHACSEPVRFRQPPLSLGCQTPFKLSIQPPAGRWRHHHWNTPAPSQCGFGNLHCHQVAKKNSTDSIGPRFAAAAAASSASSSSNRWQRRHPLIIQLRVTRQILYTISIVRKSKRNTKHTRDENRYRRQHSHSASSSTRRRRRRRSLKRLKSRCAMRPHCVSLYASAIFFHSIFLFRFDFFFTDFTRGLRRPASCTTFTFSPISF